MIIAKDFIMIHMPKTGSTYIRNFVRFYVILHIYKSMNVYILLQKVNIKSAGKLTAGKLIFKIICKLDLCIRHFFLKSNRDLLSLYHSSNGEQHDACSEIPVESQNKEILSVLRDPYKMMVSYYCYFNPTHSIPFYLFFLEREERCKFWLKKQFAIHNNSLNIGMLSFTFIRLFFKDPQKIFSLSRQAFDYYFASGDYTADMYKVKFFRQEILDRQWCEYLKHKPYLDRKLVDKIFIHRNRLFGKNESIMRQEWEKYWSEENKNKFKETERVYIQMVRELAPLPQDQF